MLVACIAAAFIAGCAHGVKAGHATKVAIEHRRSVFVNVQNKSFDDLRVYLVLHSVPIPLGWVPGYGSRRLRIWASQLGTGAHIRLVAGLPGESAPRHSTQVFNVEPGHVVDWVILEQHGVSTAIVRR
jgi:hypothetical protein